jgi:hypothetical protein
VIECERYEAVLPAAKSGEAGFCRDLSAGIELALVNAAMIKNELCQMPRRRTSRITSTGVIENA